MTHQKDSRAALVDAKQSLDNNEIDGQHGNEDGQYDSTFN